MKRDLIKLADTPFDVLVIGGGIYGAAAAWEAALRGLSVALIEKGDFGGATSSNSLKIIHGGLRYLQHADFIRMRESIVERRTVMRIAPHLIRVFPCLMPTYGHRIKGPEVMSVAMLMNDLISCDRNKSLDRSRHLPMGQIIAKEQVCRLIPGVDEKNMTAGAMWYDAQVYNSERLLFSYLHSAAAKGAEMANYVRADKLIIENQRVTGVRTKDLLTGQSFDIRARMVVNNTGAWSDELLTGISAKPQPATIRLSTAMNLVVSRPLTFVGAGISAKVEFKDKDAVISKGSRLFFIAPWRNVSMIGTWHDPYEGRPDAFHPSEESIEKMINQVNVALPGAHLSRDEVTLVHRGFLPMAGVHATSGEVSLQKHYRILDHKQDLHVDGLLSVVSVKYTTARDVATKTVDAIYKKWGKKPPASFSHTTSIDGGEMEDVATFTDAETLKKPSGLEEKAVRHLIQNYGSRYRQILHNATLKDLEPVSETTEVLQAEVRHGVTEEMALKLGDVVLRRTELGTAGHPGSKAIGVCAEWMAKELGWSVERKQSEISELATVYPG
jgi:glycerol-3-phosphate dehydrogenase